MKQLKKIALTTIATSLLVASTWAQQGVTNSEILIGSNNDLSGPFASFGGPGTKAAQMVFDDVNAIGGIHGRKIRFIVEDHGYQMPKAIAGMNKLINGDKVFAMLLSLGTPMNIAAFKLQDAKKIPNLMPLTFARQMNEPHSPLHYAGTVSYFEQMKAGVKYIAKAKGATKVCSMYLPTDYGKEIKAGTSKAVELNGLTFVAETTHKPDETDFVGALQKLKSKGCQIVTMALTVRQSITVVGTAKKLGIKSMSFLNSAAGFHSVIAKVPGGITDGLYAAAGWSDLLSRMDDPQVQLFAKNYVAKTGEKLPGTGAVFGYTAAIALVRGLEAAGKNLTTASFQKGMESLNYKDAISDSQISFSANDHQGSDEIVVSVVSGGSWKEVSRSK